MRRVAASKLYTASAQAAVRSCRSSAATNAAALTRALGGSSAYTTSRAVELWGQSNAELLQRNLPFGLSQTNRAFQTSSSVFADVTVAVPEMGDSISEGSLAAILKEVGDSVDMDECVAQIETDKVTIDVRAPTSGTITEILVAENDTVVVGTPVFKMAEGAAAPKAAAPAAPAASAAPAAPAAAAPAPPAPKPAAPSPPPKAPAAPTPPGERERRVPMTRLRKRVAERLKSSQNTLAMLTTFNEIDMTNIMALRTEYKEAFEKKHGAKLGFMSAFCKAATYALQQIPAVNGSIDGDDIVYKEYYDISIAVGSPKGLVVPVLRDVDKMSFADVEKTIAMYGKKARDGTLGIDEMAGGTFTISNGGVYGSLLSTPIINPPQSAILGMHSIQKRPMVIDGEIKIRPMMYVALTYDHRLVDGREAVTFLKHIKDVVEDPRRIVLDL
mmetsp:Transcript_26737/g.32456  ORF Transcript_26737/g.32456 Transcript_26737/m.32456 type:complete len:443 (+) Transcript_26737:74-1402(+)